MADALPYSCPCGPEAASLRWCPVLLEPEDAAVRSLLERYLRRLALPDESLQVTTDRRHFARWLGRRVGAELGGAYAFSTRTNKHLILINLNRIDLAQPKALEIVVAEELVHMRDRIDGDLRRHAKHGHDRIAHRVASLTGASLDEIRGCLLPTRRRPPRFVYACPSCDRRIARRVRGTWSCAACSPVFDRRFVLRLVEEIGIGAGEERSRRTSGISGSP